MNCTHFIYVSFCFFSSFSTNTVWMDTFDMNDMVPRLSYDTSFMCFVNVHAVPLCTHWATDIKYYCDMWWKSELCMLEWLHLVENFVLNHNILALQYFPWSAMTQFSTLQVFQDISVVFISSTTCPSKLILFHFN
jgi:hypothetical protein